MYKGIIKNLLFALFCFLVGGTAAWADDTGTTTTPVSPSISSNDEVCVFFASPSNTAKYTLYLSGGDYVGGTADPGDQLQLLGTQFDGSYLYKWERPASATGIPSKVTLYKDGTKIYENQDFVNHGLYRESTEQTVSSKDNDAVAYSKTVDHVSTGAADDNIVALDSASEISVFFETPIQYATVYAWPYGNNFNYAAGGWPGDRLMRLGEVPGKKGYYLYKWTMSKARAAQATTDDAKNADGTIKLPTGIVFSPYQAYKYNEQAGEKDQYGDVGYTNHGYYVNTITYSGAQTVVRQYGRVYAGEQKSSSDLDPLAVIKNKDEVSIFIESKDKLGNNENFKAWPWTDADRTDESQTTVKDGKYYTGTNWPGSAFDYVGQLSNKHYLYKWTQDASITDHSRNLILNKTVGSDNKDVTTILDGATFINHAYYKIDDQGNAEYVSTVVRYSDGTYTASRTTYGKRVIYEMNVGSFAGNFQSASAQLNNLKKLGVDVIWLMPIFERGNSKSPYATKNYYAINPNYGTETDLKNFVKSAHDLGMDVWLDIAINHTSMQNVWVDPNNTSTDDKDKFHPEYYIGYKQDNPTDTTGFQHAYYIENGKKHEYPDVYQLNYNYQVEETDAQGNTDSYNPADRAIRKVLEYWVEHADIDGYRFDYVSGPVPNAVWAHLTSELKKMKPTIQFLAEANLAGGDGDRIERSNFEYDYAWTFNDEVRGFGQSTDGRRLAQITDNFLTQTKNKDIDRMVYLTNHDKNWNDRKTMGAMFGNNRLAMTVYEFTMPGMPLIYNGQEQNGELLLDYFNDTRIDWGGSSDSRMLGLIQELSHLKHTNNALSDGNSPDLRGETYILNAWDSNVLAYERARGDQHVLVVLNLSGSAVSTNIDGVTRGSWKQVLIGDKDGLRNPQSTPISIGDSWYISNIPANGYEVFTFTGYRDNPDAGVYLVTEDSKNNDTKHKMNFAGRSKKINLQGSKNELEYDVYTYTIEASDFANLNTEENVTPKSTSNTLTFKMQEYYNYYIGGTVCKASSQFATSATAPIASTDTVSCSKADAAAVNSFQITKVDDALKYLITFFRGVSTKDNSQASDAGYVTVRVVKPGEREMGYYLVTPTNDYTVDEVNNDTKKWQTKHQWKFKNQIEDPDGVGDKYITDLNENKIDLCSYTIDAADFDKYVDPKYKAGDAIMFRIQQVTPTLDENQGEICPPLVGDEGQNIIFDDKNSICKDGWWKSKGWFVIPFRQDVNKYIIQTWQDGSHIMIRVRFVKKFNYEGSTIDAVSASSEDVYLYNVDTQKFLYVGNRWGTMASLLYDDLGTCLNISSNTTGTNPDYKVISTRFEGAGIVPNGHMLGIDDFGYGKTNTAFDRLDSANIFCDRNNGDEWIIEKADTIDYANTYFLRLFNEKDHRFHLMLADHRNGSSDEDLKINTQVKYVAQNVHDITVSDLNSSRHGDAAIRFNNRIINLGHSDNRDDGWLEYRYNNTEQAGTYELTVKCIFDSDTKLTVQSGDKGPQIVKTVLSSGSKSSTAKTTNVSFRIHLDKGDNTIYIAKQDTLAPNITGMSISIVRPDNLKYGRWQFVTRRDLVAKLKNENANLYGGTTADATFLLVDQGFTRNVEKTWDADNTVNWTKKEIGHNPDNGMYWNAHIQGYGRVYQEVTVPVYGVYKFDAYGFYNGSVTNMFAQYQKKDGSWSDPTTINLVEDKTESYSGTGSAVSTGEMFYKESVLSDQRQHLNTLYFYVPQSAEDDGGYCKIRIGFNKTANADGDYTAVDDVHLHYNGKATFILRDTVSNVDNFDAEDRTNTPVWLYRRFAIGQWNTLVLPVPVSAQQLRQTFGPDVQVASPYGLDDLNPYLIRFTPVDLNSGAGASGLQAGKFYIIKPGNKTVGTKTVLNLEKKDDGTYDPHTETAADNGYMYYDLGSHDINNLSKTVEPLTIRSLDFHAASDSDTLRLHNAINIIGSYHKFQMPKDSYAFTSQGRVVKWKGDPVTLNGYRFYIVDVPNEDSNQQKSDSKAFVMGSLSDDLEGVLNSFKYQNGGKGETTGINEINNSDNSQDVHGTVFDLSGRRVGENGNIDNLPKGVYIINGKKYIKD